MNDKLDIPCRFGCRSPAVGIYYMPRGCICWPDPIQALCMQHFVTAESVGPVTLILDLTEKK